MWYSSQSLVMCSKKFNILCIVSAAVLLFIYGSLSLFCTHHSITSIQVKKSVRISVGTFCFSAISHGVGRMSSGSVTH